MILPSHDENFGNVVIESLSVGTSVLISKYVGLADYVRKNNIGWICDLDENNIAGLINDIATEKKKLIDTRTQAPLLVRHDFSDEALIKAYMEMYKQFIGHD